MTEFKLPIIDLEIDGQIRQFDISNPKTPDWLEEAQLTSDNYPYIKRLKRKHYEKRLETLQIELVKLQAWLQESGCRVAAIFEGRDAAGKGGTIAAIRENMNPRTARNVALPKPTDLESAQWYFQRYVAQLPSKGEFVTFDRSWYNRAVVEPVMGFCTEVQYKKFMDAVCPFEGLLVQDGIYLFKFWLNIGQATQMKRFHDRLHSPLKSWKFSPVDIKGMGLWSEYTHYRDEMIARTHHEKAPWTIVKANDKRRLRIAVATHILSSVPYEGKNIQNIGMLDEKILSKA